MRRFIITSEKFTGEVEVWYGFDGLLCRIDLLGASLDYVQIDYLRTHISPDVHLLAGCFKSATMRLKEAPLDFTVEDFCKAYPYSRNMHLLPARWGKMGRNERIMAVFAANDYAAYCKRNEKWYKPMIADSWLSKKEYLNDWKKM